MNILGCMKDIVNKAKRHTDSNILNSSISMLPKFVDLKFSIIRTNKYRYDGNTVIDNDHIIVKVENIRFKSIFISNKKETTFRLDLEEAIQSRIFPVLIFINGRHVRWSNITLVNDTRYMYLLISKTPFDNKPIVIKDIERIDCLQLPFNVVYTENRSDPPNDQYKELLRFSLDGELVDVGKVIYYVNDKNLAVSSYILPSGEINDYDLRIDHKYTITSNNILVFRKRLLDRDSKVNVNKLNMLYVKGDKEVPYKIKCFYKTNIDSAYNIITKFPNIELAKDIVYHSVDNERLNTDIVNTSFDFSDDPSKSFEDNLKSNFRYITSYDSSYISEIYRKFNTIESRTYTGKEIATKLRGGNQLSMALLDYKNNDTKVIVFCNGEIYKNYHLLKYNLDSFSMLIDTNSLKNDDIFEIIFIKNVNNHTEYITYTKGNRYKTQKMFSDDELLLYTKEPKGHKYLKFRELNERSWFPVDYTIDNGNVIVEDYYVNRKLLYATKNQFKYSYRIIQKECIKIRLPEDFMASLNPNQYLVFLNGRLMNREFYRLTIPSIDNIFTDLYVYSRIKFHQGDRIEIFYMPIDFDPMDYANNLVTRPISMVITNRTRDAVIVPYPFNLYSRKHDFLLFKNSVYVDPNRYRIEQGMLYFTDGTIYNKGDRLVFVFVYNRCTEQEAYQYIDNDNGVFVEQIQLLVEKDNQTSFKLDEDRYIQYLIEGNSIMLLYHGMHIPSEYWKLNRFTGEITFAPNSFKMDDYITVIIYHLSDKAMKIGNSIFSDSVLMKDIGDFPIEEFNKILTDDILVLGKDGITDKLLPDGKSIALTGDTIVTKEDIDNLIGDNKFDRGLNKIEIKFTAIKDYQYDFDVSKISILPQTNVKEFTIVDDYFNIDEYLSKGCPIFIIRNGVLQAEGYHYTILRKNNKINFVKPFMDNEEFYLITYTSPNRSVRLYEYDILIEDKNQTLYNIKSRFGKLDQAKYRFIIYVGSLMLDSRRYDVDENYNLTFIDNTMFEIGQHIRIFALYVSTDTSQIFEYNHLGSTRYHTIDQVDINFEKGRYIYDIPYPDGDIDTGFLVICGGILIDSSRYTIDTNTKTIRFLDKQDLLFKENVGFKIIFIYDKMKGISISSAQSETLSRVLNSYSIPVPFSNYFKLNNSVLVFVGGTILDPEYYNINMNTNIITLNSMAGLEGRVLSFIFIYQNSYKNIGYVDDNVIISNIRKSGYIFISKDVLLDHPLDKSLFWVFINGKKISISDLKNISSNLVRVVRDQQSRHNLVLLSHTRRIEELDDYFKMYSNYDTMINNLDVEDLNRLFNEFRVLSDTEPYHDMDISKEALVNEIVRDWYGRTGYYKGDKFTNSYKDFTEASDVQVDLGTGEEHSMVLDSSKYYSARIDRSNTNNIDE